MLQVLYIKRTSSSLFQLILKALQCIWCRFCTHNWNFMPAQRGNAIWKSWAFVRLYVCYKCKNNHLYHVSKEDVQWLSYSFHNNIIGFIIRFIITVLVSHVWKVSSETMLPFVDSTFLCSLFTRYYNSQYLKRFVSIFFLVFDLINCCKFQKPMAKPILKESVAK